MQRQMAEIQAENKALKLVQINQAKDLVRFTDGDQATHIKQLQ